MLNTLFGGRAYQTYSANIAKSAYDPRLQGPAWPEGPSTGERSCRDGVPNPADAGRRQGPDDQSSGRWIGATGIGSIMADYTIQGAD